MIVLAFVADTSSERGRRKKKNFKNILLRKTGRARWFAIVEM